MAQSMSRRIGWMLLCGAIAAFLLGSRPAAALPDSPTAGTVRSDHAHDFDFEFGSWTVQLRRRVRPLTGSDSWIDYQGTSVVRRIWDGAANLGELRVHGPAGSIQALSLRLFDPASQQWKISFANRAAPDIGVPMIGRFERGRGEFFDGETLDGRPIFVRFVFSHITPISFTFEQSFSGDGGRSWEPNWVATFRRADD